MQDEVRSVWRDMRADDSINVEVVTGSGDRAFCAGIDRNQPMTATEGKVFGTSNPFIYDDPGDDLGPKSCDMWKPVLAAVNGMACGGAFYLLAEADIILAAEHATFFDPHVTYGMAAVYEPMKMLGRNGDCEWVGQRGHRGRGRCGRLSSRRRRRLCSKTERHRSA